MGWEDLLVPRVTKRPKECHASLASAVCTEPFALRVKIRIMNDNNNNIILHIIMYIYIIIYIQ